MKVSVFSVAAVVLAGSIYGCTGDTGATSTAINGKIGDGASAFTGGTTSGNPGTEQRLPFQVIAKISNHDPGTFVLRSAAAL